MEHHGPTSWLLQLPLLPHDEHYLHVNAAVVVFLVIAVGSVVANRMIANQTEKHLIPSSKFSLVNLVDIIIEGMHNLCEGTLGPTGHQHFSFIASLFIFVLVSNLFGLLPLSSAPTSNFNTTLALGLMSYLYFNAWGIKAHGLKGYLSHFTMGLGIIGIFIAPLEIISHAIRPMSLGIRLFLNMFVDHTLSGAFGQIFEWILPVPLLLFGVLVSIIQAFVFALLNAVYIQMATEHEAGADHH